MNETSPVDAVVIAELRSIMGDEFGLLVQTFESDSVNRIQALREHVAASEAESLRQVAHSFKGSAANFGANRLAGLCQMLETMGKSSDLEGAASCLGQLEAEFVRVSGTLKAMTAG